jgi:hypothetical protein
MKKIFKKKIQNEHKHKMLKPKTKKMKHMEIGEFQKMEVPMQLKVKHIDPTNQ